MVWTEISIALEAGDVKLAVGKELKNDNLALLIRESIRRPFSLNGTSPRSCLDLELGQAILICEIFALNHADILHLEKR